MFSFWRHWHNRRRVARAIDVATKAGVKHVVKSSVAGADSPFDAFSRGALSGRGPAARVGVCVDHAAPATLHDKRSQLGRHDPITGCVLPANR